MKRVYTEDAVADLIRLREFIAVHNPHAAARMASELVNKIELLPDFPELGVSVRQAPDPASLRDIIFGQYIVRYSVHADTIIILRVWHSLEGERMPKT